MPSKKNKKKTTKRKKTVCCSACEVGRKCSAKTAKKKTARKTRTSGKSRSSGTRHPPTIVYNVHAGFGDRGAANAPASNILNAPPVDYRVPPAAAAFPGAANPMGGGPPPPFGGGGGGAGGGLFPGGGGAGAPAAGPAPFGPPANLQHVNDFVQMLQLQPHLTQAPGFVRQNQQVAIRNAAIPGSEPSDGSPVHANIRTPSLATTPPNVLVQTVNEIQADRRPSPSTGSRTTVPESRVSGMPYQAMDFSSPHNSRSQISSILPSSRPSIQPRLDSILEKEEDSEVSPIPQGTDPNISSLSNITTSSFQQPGGKVRPTNLNNDFKSPGKSPGDSTEKNPVHHATPQRITLSGESVSSARKHFLHDLMDPEKSLPITYSSNKSISKDSLDKDSYLANYSKTSTPPGSLPPVVNISHEQNLAKAKRTASQRQHDRELSRLLRSDQQSQSYVNATNYSQYMQHINVPTNAGWKPVGKNIVRRDKSRDTYDSIMNESNDSNVSIA